jgi:hypothetical protein
VDTDICSGIRVSAFMRRRDTERRSDSQSLSDLITIKVDVVDARFASLDTLHYLLKVLVFDLQSITDQRACSWIDPAVGGEFSSASF